LNRPFSPRPQSSGSSYTRVNGKIRAREVRVIGADGHQYGVLSLQDALNLARNQAVDLVEIAANATPPVCRLVDYGKFRYEQAKKDKESKKRHHANKVKEVQLSPSIDPHDFGVKLSHAVDFLCEDMKVKITLRFRGREMAHKEFGFQVVQKFVKEVAPYGHPDAAPKLVGKGIVLMISPLPRAKRAKNPRVQAEAGAVAVPEPTDRAPSAPTPKQKGQRPRPDSGASPAQTSGGFANNPFAEIKM